MGMETRAWKGKLANSKRELIPPRGGVKRRRRLEGGPPTPRLLEGGPSDTAASDTPRPDHLPLPAGSLIPCASQSPPITPASNSRSI